MSKPKPWLAFYVADYLRDTSHLSLAEHGAYSLLLYHSWETGPIADDDDRIARILRCSVKEWKKLAPAVRAFFIVEDGKLIQKRLEAERAKAAEIIAERSVAGKAGAAKRWGGQDNNDGGPGGNRTSKRDAKPIANAMASAMANGAANGLANSSQIDAHLPSPLPSASPPLPPKPKTSIDGVTPCRETGRSTVNGFYLEVVGERIVEIAKIDPARWRGDYQPVIAWLRDGIFPETIYAAVKRVASRPDYNVPFSLKFFERAVREQPQEIAA